MSRSEITIDLGAIRSNVELLRGAAAGADLMAVVKADAYGHGLVACAGAARAGGAGWLGTALLDEALVLRAAGDTGPVDMRWAADARAAGPVRLAILPIGAYHFAGNVTDNHIGPDQAVTAFQQLGAGYALGVHWGTFELTSEGINEPPEHLRTALIREHIPINRFRTPEASEPWVIE